MLTLEETKQKTELVFDKKEFSLAEPTVHCKDQIEAYRKCGLETQASSLIFDLRCAEVEKLGFVHYDSSDLVKMLMGEEHDEVEYTEDRQNHEWMYNHHTDTIKVLTECTWGGVPTDFIRYETKKVKSWFSNKIEEVLLDNEKWRCRFGKLNYLKRTIPYGVVLRINELKEAKTFNAFSVLAPMEAWERKTDIDPIVVGSIWEIIKNEDKNSKNTLTSGQVKHYFIAQW